MNIEEAKKKIIILIEENIDEWWATKEDIDALNTLLIAYENQQKEIQDLIINQCIYQDTSSCTRSISLKMYTELNNYIRKDKIKPIQIIDLDGKIHNVYKIEEE